MDFLKNSEEITLKRALLYIFIAMVGLLESLMTATVVDDLTQTPSSRDRECMGLGLANMASSPFGGIAGCGMIGRPRSGCRARTNRASDHRR